MRFVGLDVHKRVVEAAIVDGKGAVKKRARFCCAGEEIERFARDHLQARDKVALEATSNTWAVVALLKPHVEECWSPIRCAPARSRRRR